MRSYGAGSALGSRRAYILAPIFLPSSFWIDTKQFVAVFTCALGRGCTEQQASSSIRRNCAELVTSLHKAWYFDVGCSGRDQPNRFRALRKLLQG